jgi:hypothetical protein
MFDKMLYFADKMIVSGYNDRNKKSRKSFPITIAKTV